MRKIPDGYRVRSAAASDVDALTVLFNDYGRRIVGTDLITTDRLMSMMTTPGFSPEADGRVVLDAEGRLAAAAVVFDVSEPHVRVSSWGIVDAEHQGRGVGAFLFAWILDRARRAIDRAPADARVVLEQNVFEEDRAAAAFLTERGFRSTRHFRRMAIDLQEEIAEPVWPDDIRPTPVDVETELEESVRAVNEAFRDHYGHVEGSFEQQVERTRHRIESDPHYDPGLNFVARDGDAIAGVCFCHPVSGTDRDAGYVGALGVLRPWRKRGLGLALLLEAFHRFRAKGKQRAHLHVDAESLTGATRLYRKAGMHVDRLNHEYTLELRPGVDLAARAPQSGSTSPPARETEVT